MPQGVMRAVRLSSQDDDSIRYTPSTPAPSSALQVLSDVEMPVPLQPNELLIRVRASTVIRDELTWPETYSEDQKILGHDFAGTVVALTDGPHGVPFKVGDEVYGMTEASRAGAWADYMVVTAEEACMKPPLLSWTDAAAVPLSALTAYQALFEKAGIRSPDFHSQCNDVETLTETAMEKPRVLITGAAGGVGNYLVPLAKAAGVQVTASSSSNERNKDFLLALGADEVLEYQQLKTCSQEYQVIIDTVGGEVLKPCWSLVTETGSLVSVDSSSWDFVREHRETGVARGKDGVNALFFIVSPSTANLEQLSAALQDGLIKPLVAAVLPLEDARLAYELASHGSSGRGKVLLRM